MAGKNTAVFGIFQTRAQAEEGVDTLVSNGFRAEDISVLMADNVGTKDFAHEKNTKAPEGTTTGAVAGGIAGGTVGLLAGLGALAIPGIGPLLAAGPIVAALAGVGAGGTVGGLIGALVGLGIPEFEAKRYEGMIKEGRILLSVHCDNSDWVDRAKLLLERTGAQHVSSKSEASADYAKTDKPRVRHGGGGV
jgi:hypothetical protein